LLNPSLSIKDYSGSIRHYRYNTVINEGNSHQRFSLCSSSADHCRIE
jgi:hypothetical protein